MRIERRKAARNRVYQGASVVFNGRQSVMDCTLRNRSDTGAMVRMTDWIALPQVFEIDVPGKGLSLKARQCWRRGDDVGVAFLTEAEAAPQPPVSFALMQARRAAAAGKA